MSGQKTILIGDRRVGPGYPAYLVAEIGINHNGDLQLAKRTIDAAKASGADAVKFQNYRTEDFVPTLDEVHTYTTQGETITESQHAMFKRYELSIAKRLASTEELQALYSLAFGDDANGG